MMLQAGTSPVRDSIRLLKFSIYLILPGLGIGVYSTSDRNDYQKQKKRVSEE
jgi:hypothetical protein